MKVLPYKGPEMKGLRWGKVEDLAKMSWSTIEPHRVEALVQDIAKNGVSKRPVIIIHGILNEYGQMIGYPWDTVIYDGNHMIHACKILKYDYIPVIAFKSNLELVSPTDVAQLDLLDETGDLNGRNSS